MNSPEFKGWYFICLSELSGSNIPDSYYDGYSMTLTKTIIALRKEVISHLAPTATTFLIDGKKVTEDEFEQLSGSKIQTITLNGDTVEIKLRLIPQVERNPETSIVTDNESRLMKSVFPGQ